MNILLLEDVAEDYELILRQIKRTDLDFTPKWVQTKNEYINAISESCPDIILSDFKLPQFDGLAAMEIAKEACPDTPFIIVTGSIDEETAVSCMKAGAADCILKDQIMRLGIAVKEALRNRELQVEKKSAEAQFKKFYRAVEYSPVSILITDLSGSIEYVNPRFTEITGYRREDVLGKNPNMLKSGAITDEVYAELWKTILSGRVWHGELHNKKKNGDLFWEYASISPMMDDMGNITHFIGIKEDITEKKRFEQNLRQTQKMEAIGQLAGGIAHDFNNILSAIIGYTSLINMKIRNDDPLKVYADNILMACEKAANLTKGLLVYSRRNVTDFTVVLLNESLHRVERLVSRLIGEDIDFRLDLSEQDLFVNADSGQLDQIFINLCTNARDAMPDGGTLCITTEEVFVDDEFSRIYGFSKSGMYAMVTVKDSGNGIEPEQLEKIFEPFFTTKDVGKGTGLGLSIAYGIVQQHGGHITVASEIGKGTEFHIYLPVASNGHQLTQHVAKIDQSKHGTETILLAEDDADLRKLAKELLVEFGYNVIEASDGEEAIRMFACHQDSVDLLILDVIMPKLNGMAVYEEISRIKPDMKTLFISGYTADLMHQKGIAQDKFSFIQKPVSPSVLLRKIREVLEI
ncbi:MAG: response regulator [Nitrospiraceae bacterium]|nr:response regulator [Nitrospiraceae bacterium]